MKLPRAVLGSLLAVVALSVLGAGVYLRIQGAEDSGGDDASAAIAAPASAAGAFGTDISIPVAGAPAVRGTLVIAVSAAGQAAARSEAALLAQVPGRVEAVSVREGDVVAAGTPLVTLDAADYEVGLAEARAQHRQAEAQYRELTLFDERIEDAAVREERERVARAKSGLDGAEAGVRRAELELARTRVAAPFAGRAASMHVVPGQWVRAGDSLLVVLDLDPIRVEVQVLESEVGFLARGGRAAVSFAAFPGETFEGRVEAVNPVVDRQSRTAKVTVAVANPRGRILPGMYARVALDARRFADRILVPRAAILERDRRTMLFVYEGDERGGLAKWRYVTTGLENDSLVEIVASDETEMVESDEVVLTDGHYTLIHDARVRLVEDVSDAGGRPQ